MQGLGLALCPQNQIPAEKWWFQRFLCTFCTISETPQKRNKIGQNRAFLKDQIPAERNGLRPIKHYFLKKNAFLGDTLIAVVDPGIFCNAEKETETPFKRMIFGVLRNTLLHFSKKGLLK